MGGLCTAFEVIKPGAIDKLKEIAGPDSVEEARKTSPGSLHAKYGLVGYKNGVYVAKSHQSATEVEFIIWFQDYFINFWWKENSKDCCIQKFYIGSN